MHLTVPAGGLAVDLSTDPVKLYNSAKFNCCVNNLVGSIHHLNLPLGTSIGVLGNNSVSWMITAFAIFQTEHVCVPINFKLPLDNIHSIMQQTNIGLVFCDKNYRHMVPGDIPVIEFGSEFESLIAIDYNKQSETNYERICLTLMTSGTTGVPKKVNFTLKDRLVPMSHQKKIQTKSDAALEPARVLIANPFFNNVGLGVFTNCILDGCQVFCLANFDPKTFLQSIEKYKIQMIHLVTPMMSMILDEHALIQSLNLTSVVQINLLASYADDLLIDRIKKVFTNVVSVINPYGLTETGVILGNFNADKVPIPPGSAGCPAPWVECKLIDDVLHIKTSSLLSKFQTDDTEWFNTNDRFQIDQQGFYYYLGRVDDMLKCGGNKVYPIEIESVLNQHDWVEESVAIGLPDKIKGHKPYAFVKLTKSCDENALIKYAAKNLATYQIPKRIWEIESWPLTSIGKIDKKFLTKLAEQYIKV